MVLGEPPALMLMFCSLNSVWNLYNVWHFGVFLFMVLQKVKYNTKKRNQFYFLTNEMGNQREKFRGITLCDQYETVRQGVLFVFHPHINKIVALHMGKDPIIQHSCPFGNSTMGLCIIVVSSVLSAPK